jgi:signal transduction histidine kinase
MVRLASPAARAETRSRVRVLVVDDNTGFRESLVSLLDTEPLEVVAQVGSGEEALRSAAALQPHVVIMDVRMPSMDGVETTRRLKAMLPSIEVVALTGSEDQRQVREMLVAGATGYVLKDSGGQEILNAVIHAATGQGLLSPQVTPTVIEELTEALERERHRTRQLEIAQEALLERAARRHEIVSRLGHELRTPVTVILGMAQTLASGRVPPDRHDEILGRLVDRASSLARLVQRFEGAVEAGLTEWADVAEVAHEVASAHPRVRVEAAGTPAMASLNRAAARRILEELVDNALAFSPNDCEVVVRVTLNGPRPEVRVIDRGPGVAPEAVERIFGALEQGEQLTTRVHQGAGLGLAVARMSAHAMDGDVTLESTSLEGSSFLWVVSRSA